MYTFSKNLEATYKFWASEGRYEANITHMGIRSVLINGNRTRVTG